MVVFSLEVKATVDNLETLYTPSDYIWCVKVKCTGCNEESPYLHPFNCEDEPVEIKGGRGTVNFATKCKFCSREGTLNVVKDSIKKLKFSEKDEYLPLVKFECRGLEPIMFAPKEGWIGETSHGVEFVDIDLKENEWVGYDEEYNKPVGIYDFESRFVRG